MVSPPFPVVSLAAVDTHPLRAEVLRAGTPSRAVEFEGDHDADTLHLGIRDPGSGRVLAVSSWMARPCPHGPDLAAVQLRGMATVAARRGEGLGSALLRAGVERAAAHGARVVWARARLSALDFYLEHGFRAVGEDYPDAATGLPHRDVVIDL